MHPISQTFFFSLSLCALFCLWLVPSADANVRWEHWHQCGDRGPGREDCAAVCYLIKIFNSSLLFNKASPL